MRDEVESMEYLKPNSLHDGDRVAIIAPSSPVSSMRSIQNAFSVFEANNLVPVLGQNLTHVRSDCWSAASIKERVDEIIWAFEDSSIAGVMVAEGGYSAIELLPYLPFELVRESQKPFVGMSDVTSINNAFLRFSGLVNFLGPNIRIRDKEPLDQNSLATALRLLKTSVAWHEKPWDNMQAPARCVCEGIAKGKAIGGNLTLFTALTGTPFMPNVDGAILFFEDIHTGGFEVSLCLNQLELAGVFDSVAGVVFGEFCKVPDRGDGDLPIEDVVVRFFKKRVPCVMGMNFSHGHTVATIPLGADVLLDAEKGIVDFGNPFNVAA